MKFDDKFKKRLTFEEGAEPKTKYVRNNFKFLENSREISLLDLDLEDFSFHFHFLIVQNPLSQDPAC